MVEPFLDRSDAGHRLAVALTEYAGHSDVLVLALPRGGVPVAYEVANTLNVPLDVLVVRKLGVPGQEELAMGAIADGNTLVCNEEVVLGLGISMAAVRCDAERKAQELIERQTLYRSGRTPIDIRGKTVILIDDGMATGATMRAALSSVRQRFPSAVMVAVPVGSYEATQDLAQKADRLICLQTPEPFHAVGYWYRNFEQVSDSRVCSLLEMQRHAMETTSASSAVANV